MTMGRLSSQAGQSAVELGLILSVVLLLTAGLLDVGRSIFLYNELSAVARYGSRWGAVVGGTCALPYAASSSDWCNQLKQVSGNFWTQNGNKPLEGNGTECPNYSPTSSAWYLASNFTGSTATSIVGAVAQKFDTDSHSTNIFRQLFAPGIDLSNLHVCLETTNTSSVPAPGDAVTVNVVYVFKPAGPLFGTASFQMNAEAQYVIE